jgi:hypothetical protein
MAAGRGGQIGGHEAQRCFGSGVPPLKGELPRDAPLLITSTRLPGLSGSLGEELLARHDPRFGGFRRLD